MIKKKQNTLFLLFALLLIVSNSITAQLYVAPNTYIYNTNEFVYVTQDVNLSAPTSFFYLRKEGQLLQGTTGSGANSGLGSLSVFQEGTVNQYAFNYWCSPVGGSSATTGNSHFGITQLGVPTSTTATNPAMILAMNNYDGTCSSGALSIAPYWIWKLLYNDETKEFISIGSQAIIEAGEGFTMKGTSGYDSTIVDGVQNNPGNNQRYDFRGKPNDGTINIQVESDQFTLTGNPYPSAIDLSAFLTDPTNNIIEGVAYFWEQDKDPTITKSHNTADYQGGYGTFAPGTLGSSGIYTPAPFESFDNDGNYLGLTGRYGGYYERRFCPIGQGFMIFGTANGTVQMKNQYRVFKKEGASNFSQFEKRSQVKSKNTNNLLPTIPSVSGIDYTKERILQMPQIRLNSSTKKGLVLTMALAFDPSATDAGDFGMDAKSLNKKLNEEVYLVIGSDAYVISTTSFDINKRFPIGLRNSKATTFTINVNSVLNLPAVENIYIHDIENDTYHDIKNGIYTITMPAGINNSRFEISLTNNKNKNAHIISNDKIQIFNIIQNNSTQSFTIENSKRIDLKKCDVFNISGELIMNQTELGSKIYYNFSTADWSEGFYIIKLTTGDNQTYNQKIVVSKTN